MKVHGGEISFPGGKWCTKDQDLLETAIRETEEELCLQISREQAVGQLDNVITLNSKYRITPFVAILENISSLKPNSEVNLFCIYHLYHFEDNDQGYQSRTSLY